MSSNVSRSRNGLSDMLDAWRKGTINPASGRAPDDLDVAYAIEELIDVVVNEAIASYDASLKKGAQ